MRNTPGPWHRPSRGVSLVEALVALAVMSFGMLALIGVQSTMRINTDLSRQTSEAARMASADLESVRQFVDVRHADDQPAPSWDDLAARLETVTLPGNTGNVSFLLQRQVSPFPTRPQRMTELGLVAGEAKVIQTSVTWTDRSNISRLLRLQGMVSATAPGLTGMLILPPAADAPARRMGRHTSIPTTARDLGNGKSVYKPNPASQTVWVFDNKSGMVTQRCPSITASQSAITEEVIATCPAIGYGNLVTGTVRFDLELPAGGYTARHAEQPRGAPADVTPALASTPLAFNISNRVGLSEPLSECFAGSAYVPDGSTSTRPSAIDYQCLIYATDSSGWGGRLDVSMNIADWSQTPETSADALPSRYRVCRYTRATSEFTANADHPKSYCRVASDTCTSVNRVTRNLINQNFLVIAAGGLCPADSDNNAASGQDPLRNANTLAHQP